MPRVLDPIQFVMIALAGSMNQCQLQTLEYLREENRVLREQLGERRVRFTTTSDVDWQPRRKAWGGDAGGSRHACYTGDLIGVASKTHRSGI
jgi:hypothetical protein